MSFGAEGVAGGGCAEADGRDLQAPNTKQVLTLSYAGVAVALSGVQLITPVLPDIRDALVLSDSQVGLISSTFLFPGMFVAIPAGYVADRFGRRIVFSFALALFGLGGLLLLLFHSFPVLLIVRAVQGCAFAVLLPLGVTLIGDVLRGSLQLRAQGRRSLVASTSEIVFPLLGASLGLLAWYAPFVLQLAALPLSVYAWRALSDGRDHYGHRMTLPGFAELFKFRSNVALQALGYFRFLYKFAIITYVPILLAGKGYGAMFIAAMLSSIAVSGAFAALSAHRFLLRVSASNVVLWGVAINGFACLMLAVANAPVWILVSVVVVGYTDVLCLVMLDSLTVVAVPDAYRGSFTATGGALRNAGKFSGPALIGALLLVSNLPAIYMGLAAATIFVAPVALLLKDLDPRLAPA